MAFEGLTEKISSAFKGLRSKGRLTEADVKDAMREIRMALLEADVNFKVAKDFIKAVTEKGGCMQKIFPGGGTDRGSICSIIKLCKECLSKP